jgi:hypothetical protein
MSHGPSRDKLLTWYWETFVPDPERGHALMTPPWGKGKYTRRADALTIDLLQRAFTGETRRLAEHNETGKRWHDVPYSFAVVPEHQEGWARAAMIDVDSGGVSALQRALDEARKVGLWGFAQLGSSDIHSGGHLYFPAPDQLTTHLLHDLASRLQARAAIEGEAYPCKADLRLPLMPHLRAPGGPQRFPLLLPDGTQIAASDPWQALAELYQAWQPSPVEAFTAALEQLPPVAWDNPRKLHKSEVNPMKGSSVIAWFNENHDLTYLLEGLGVQNADGRRTVKCPFHDDRSPSLTIFYRTVGNTRHLVCRCHSKQSGCIAAAVPYFDAFNLYCLTYSLAPAEAVRELSEKHQLGRRRTFQVEEGPAAAEGSIVESGLETREEQGQSNEKALANHLALVSAERARLATVLPTAARKQGTVTVLNATMGLGKTHQGADLALQEHQAGRRVAIVAPSGDHAVNEWAARLGPVSYIWKAKKATCTCYPGHFLDKLGTLGYTLPECKEGCPYLAQFDACEGRIPIFQHNHLHINHGKLLIGYDLVIVDESPFSSLLESRTARSDDVRKLWNRLANPKQPTLTLDPALPLLAALWHVGYHAKPGRTSLRGRALVEAIEAQLGGQSLLAAIEAAKQSPVAEPRQLPPVHALTTKDAGSLPPIFFGRLLLALEQTARRPDHGAGLAWGLHEGGGAWLWYDRHQLMAEPFTRLDRPAVLVLDGSANELVNQRLFAPWNVETIALDLPISPAVQVIQVPCTAHTRLVLQDPRKLEYLARYVGITAQHQGLVIEGGVTFLAAVDHMAASLGGEWLYYGGQRGRNDLRNVRTLALVGSPTVPPDAIERQTLALWADDPAPLATGEMGELWEKRGTGDYQALDERLAAVDRLHGPEELRQAAHRARLVLAEEAKTVLVFSPWDLEELGLTPHQLVTELPHGNSVAAREAWEAYQSAADLPARAERGGEIAAVLQQNRDSEKGNKDIEPSPPIRNCDFNAERPSGPQISARKRSRAGPDPATVIPPPLSPLPEGASQGDKGADGWLEAGPSEKERDAQRVRSAWLQVERGSFAFALVAVASIVNPLLRAETLTQIAAAVEAAGGD